MEVNNDQLAAFFPRGLCHCASRCDAEARTETEHQVSLATIAKASIKILLPQVLTKVDDGVLQWTAAAWVIALPSGLVRVDFLRIASAEVTHVVFATLGANLEVPVAVDLGDSLLRDTGLAVQAVGVLRDDVLKQATVHQLNKRHVRLCRKSLCHTDTFLRLRNIDRLTSFPCCLGHRAFFPRASTCRKARIDAGTVVSNTRRGADTCTGERTEML